MGLTRTINYRFIVFFNLSFIGDKWAAINDKWIFFIFSKFLPDFLLYIGIF